MPAVNVDGLSLTYETHGDPDGTPLLLIMGLGLQLVSWPETFCRGLVEQGFYVIRFDNRDSGLSSKMDHFGKPNLALAAVKALLRLPLSSAYTLDDMASDAVGLLSALGIDRAHIVGVSMGGMIAQIIAARHSHRALSLTSIMSSSGRRSLPGPTMAARRVLLARPANPHDLDCVITHLMHTFRVIGSPGYPTPDDVLYERIAATVKRNVCTAGTARQLLAIAASGDRVSLLKSIRVPSLVVHGTHDPLVPVACGRDTARLIPGAVLHEIDGMGHDLAPGLVPVLLRLIGEHCRPAAANKQRHTSSTLPGH